MFFYWKIHFYDSGTLTSIRYRLCVSVCNKESILSLSLPYNLAHSVILGQTRIFAINPNGVCRLPNPPQVISISNLYLQTANISKTKPINYLFTSLMYDIPLQDEYATNIRAKWHAATRCRTTNELIINLWHRWPQFRPAQANCSAELVSELRQFRHDDV